MKSKAHYIETISEEKVPLGELHLEKHMLGNGKISSFEVYHLPPFAIILPYNKNLKKFLLIRQYRPSWQKLSLEFPAGGSDKNDASLNETAKRELEEETGYKAINIQEIGIFKHSSRSNRDFGVFYTDSMVESKTNFDEGEFIEEQLWMTENEIDKAISNREIVDGSHIMSWYLYQRRIKGDKKTFIL